MKVFSFFIIIFFALGAQAQETTTREFDFKTGGAIEITNLHGRVHVEAAEANGEKILIEATAQKPFSETALKTNWEDGRLSISVAPEEAAARIDLTVKVPVRTRVKVETEAGEVRIEGNIESAEVLTDTGTISTNVPLDALKYNFVWTRSRPRFLSDAQLEEVEEKSAGRFVMSGRLGELAKKKENRDGAKSEDSHSKKAEEASDETTDGQEENDKEKSKAEKRAEKRAKEKEELRSDKRVVLNFTTGRGIVLLNVAPSEVPSDLRERPLTEAAKSIVKSGDSLLTEAIRRASPKHFGAYAKTLPPRKETPSLSAKTKSGNFSNSQIKRVLVKVTDANNRAVGGLLKEDFSVQESGNEREVLAVEPTTAPFNLVLLLDVSGSVENYVNFIRKAARNFTGTMRPEDKISIVVFNEDVKQISTFTTDREKLSESLDTFDAGGGTAYYDSLAFTLVDTLRPFRGERTAIIILSDGDDNRSFLPFESLLGSIQESGALIYPLYVPSGLIASSTTTDASSSADPLRSRYMALTTRAETEGKRLAEVSGGVYYPIRRLDELQKAYDDIVVQLRTAYTVTFRSGTNQISDRASPRLKIKVKRQNTFVNTGSVVSVPLAEAEKLAAKEVSENLDYMREGSEPSFFFARFVQQPPEITGEVFALKYKPLLTDNLQIIPAENLDINKSPPAFILNDGSGGQVAVSRWVSPKRTRSYPYERIYNTLSQPKRITVIPVLKDEGAGGERDFLQFDTVSLLNLLDVYLIPGFYADAERDSADELTDQRFDNAYVLDQIEQIQSFRGTAAEWNLKQIENISAILERAKTSYEEISRKTGVRLHDEKGVDNFARKIEQSLDEFRRFSRQKSQMAQSREFQTVQPKESLSTDTKARVTISDRQGGKYFFTCDETRLENKTVYLIEAKHSARAKMPSASDIKDVLLKMMLYANLRNVRVGSKPVASRAVLRLTSAKLVGAISSSADPQEVENFLLTNRFTVNQKNFIKKLFAEARENNFEIRIEKAEIEK